MGLKAALELAGQFVRDHKEFRNLENGVPNLSDKLKSLRHTQFANLSHISHASHCTPEAANEMEYSGERSESAATTG